jgi:hypothetical protein
MAEQQDKRTWTEEIEVAGGELVSRIKSLIAEGNVRHLRIKAPGGGVYFETPLTVGVLAGGAVALAAPWLAILSALAALAVRMKVEVVRESESAPSAAKKRKTSSASKSAPKRAARGGAKGARKAKPKAPRSRR